MTTDSILYHLDAAEYRLDADVAQAAAEAGGDPTLLLGGPFDHLDEVLLEVALTGRTGSSVVRAAFPQERDEVLDRLVKYAIDRAVALAHEVRDRFGVGHGQEWKALADHYAAVRERRREQAAAEPQKKADQPPADEPMADWEVELLGMDLPTAVARRKAADEQLVTAMRAAQDAGTSANDIARQVAGLPGYGRNTVLEMLGAETLRQKAERILKAAGWDVGVGGDAHIYLGRKREVLVDLTGDEQPGSVAALNAASALCTALHQGGLRTWAGGSPDPWECLARGESIEITEPAD